MKKENKRELRFIKLVESDIGTAFPSPYKLKKNKPIEIENRDPKYKDLTIYKKHYIRDSDLDFND